MRISASGKAGRFAFPLAFLLCMATSLAAQPLGRSLAPSPTRSSNAAPRILVKLRAPFETQVETALPLASLSLSAGGVTDPQIRDFMTRSSARTLRPLYPTLVRAKKQRQVSDLQLATEIQQRFRARARRLRTAFQPPEISRTYVLELGATAQDLPRILASLKADPNVEFAQEDRTISVNFTPNDPYFSSSGTWGQPYDDLWGIKKIGAPAAWDTTTGSGVVVAVVEHGHRLQPPRDRGQCVDESEARLGRIPRRHTRLELRRQYQRPDGRFRPWHACRRDYRGRGQQRRRRDRRSLAGPGDGGEGSQRRGIRHRVERSHRPWSMPPTTAPTSSATPGAGRAPPRLSPKPSITVTNSAP